MNTECDISLARLVGRTSTAASIINLVRPTTVASGQFITTSVHPCLTQLTAHCDDRRLKFVTQFHRKVPLYLEKTELLYYTL